MLENGAFENASVGAQDELAFFSAFDDERLAAEVTGRGLFAAQDALGRDSRDRWFVAVGAGDVPAHAGADSQGFVVLLAARNDQVVAAVRAQRDHASSAARSGRDADVEGVGAVGAADVFGLDLGCHASSVVSADPPPICWIWHTLQP